MTPQELIELRSKYGQTQDELANAIGVYRPRISEWERGLFKMNKVYEKLIREYYAKKEKSAISK